MPQNVSEPKGGDSAPSQLLVRPARLDEAEALAALMVEGMNTRLNDLGPEIVVILHRHMITSSHSACLVAERDGMIVGYASVLMSTRRFHREFLLRHGLRCALIALPRLLRPANLRNALRALAYFPNAPRNDPDTEFVCLVVNRKIQRTGAGAALYDAEIEQMRLRGIKSYKISTAVENQAANAMYVRIGCRLVRTEPFYQGNLLNVYVHDIA